jgi:cyclophilin family peptidyl-prolyl cis-trans isomerase
MRPSPVPAALGVAIALASLSASALAQDAIAAEVGPPDAQPLAETRCLPSGTGTGVRVTTEEGDFVVGLFDETAPVATENFLNLAEAGYYDGVGFHRLVPGFVIQGGDPEGTGRGGPGYTIADEPVIGTYERGTVAMARTPEPNSQGSQFFVVLDDAAQGALEAARTYTIFGTVVEGMDVVDRIAAGETSGEPENAAVDPVLIESIAVEPVTLPEPDSAVVLPDPSADGSPLAAVVPVAVCGRPMTQSTFAGDDIIANAAEDDPIREIADVAEAQGATVSDLSVVSAQTGEGAGKVALLAATIAGVPAADVADDLTRILMQLEEGAATERALIGGREVTTIAPGGPRTLPVHVLASGDVLWFVSSEGDVLESLLAGLP